MKNLLFGLFATVLFAFNGNAQENPKSDNAPKDTAFLLVKTGDEQVKYQFNSIKEFEENTDKILDELTTNANSKVSGCQVTVEVSITVTSGMVSTTVTGSVTAPCSSIAAAVKRLRAQLIAAITG
jgi:hypothetical protein